MLQFCFHFAIVLGYWHFSQAADLHDPGSHDLGPVDVRHPEALSGAPIALSGFCNSPVTSNGEIFFFFC